MPAFSSPLQDLLNSLPDSDIVNTPFWLEADLFLNAANIIRWQDSLLLPQNVSDMQPIPAHDKIFTTANSDHEGQEVDDEFPHQTMGWEVRKMKRTRVILMRMVIFLKTKFQSSRLGVNKVLERMQQ